MTFAFAFDLGGNGGEGSGGAAVQDDIAAMVVDTVPPRQPFQWMSALELQQRLHEACQEEILCHEIHLDDTLEETRELEKNIGESVQDNNTAVNLGSILRWSLKKKEDSENNNNNNNNDDDASAVQLQVVTPGIYEGGAQVWECSLDLVRFLHTQEQKTLLGVLATQDTRILELGCGHALPSLYLLRQICFLVGIGTEPVHETKLGSTQFDLIDYNAPVIHSVTVPNLVLNCLNALIWEQTTSTKSYPDHESRFHHEIQRLTQTIRCATGDWMGLLRNVPSTDHETQEAAAAAATTMAYDLILAAETLYTHQTARETCHLLERLLKPDTGVAYLATKRYYFGVGGGSTVFRVQCARTNILQVTTAQVVDNGQSNIREILKVTAKPTEA